MLSIAKEKLIRSLQTKKGRDKSGQCLVEGQKVIDVADKAIEFTFTAEDTEQFRQLVTTEKPQSIAAVANIPLWQQQHVEKAPTIVVLDGVQDPGNVGSILRLCLGFNASLILIDSVDVTNPKVIRSSVGAIFQVPWWITKRETAANYISNLNRPTFRLENTEDHESIAVLNTSEPCILIAGSEGSGISLPVSGTSIAIDHSDALESLNVTHAVAITLHARFSFASNR